MRWLDSSRLRLRSFFRRRTAERELSEELRLHLEREIEQYVARGMGREEARRRALVDLGGVEQVKEACREARGWNFVQDSWRDLGYGARMLRKNPGFCAVAILTLALGIGASTAIFSVVDAVLLRPLPYPNPQQIVCVYEQARDGHRMHLADPNFDDFRAQNRTLSGLAQYGSAPESVSGGSEPVRTNVGVVSQDFFEVLGVEPFRGREFAPGEQRWHGAPAMIVSYRYWQRYLGGRADFSPVRLSMEGAVYSVVGVMPPGFDFPPGVSAWVPREQLYGKNPYRNGHNGIGIGRLRDGASVQQARADLDTIARRIRAQYGEQADLTGAVVVPLAEDMVGNVRTALLTLFGAVLLLFLVACANVAGLLVARTSARRKELAMRAALGAGRGRLVRQLLAESLEMALAGGLLGILLAAWTTRLLPAILPADLPRQQGITINATVLLFTLAATLAVAAGLGLFAAWRAGGADLSGALGHDSRTFSGGSRRFRAALVIGQIAATSMLLVGAGLLGRSFLRLISVSPGFSGRNLMILRFSAPQPPSAMTFQWSQAEIARQAQFLDEALARLRAIPGVESAGVAGGLPVADADGFPDGAFLILNGRPAPSNATEWTRMAHNPKLAGHALYGDASAGYFRTLGIPLLGGRLFDAQDGPGAPNVALISETLAREKWPHENPIGQVIDFSNIDGNPNLLTIVGVVGDVRAEGLDRPASPIIYVHFRQRGLGINTAPAIVLRTALPASAIVPAARGIFHEFDPNAPVQFSTFAQELGGWLAERRFLLLLAGVFAAAALALAAVGIYGVVAHSAAQRTREIGIRLALGAERKDVLRLVLGEGGCLAAIGVLIGLAASFAATQWISSLLFEVKPADGLTFSVVAALLSVVALLASYIPARRAMRVDPVTALRHE